LVAGSLAPWTVSLSKAWQARETESMFWSHAAKATGFDE